MKTFKSILALALIALGVSSCTKEDQPLDPKDSNLVLEFYNEVPSQITSTVTSPFPVFAYSFPAVPGQEQTFEIPVNNAGAGASSSPINFEIELAPEALVAYNATVTTKFTELPASLYTLPTGAATIPAGQKRTTVSVKLKTADFDFSKQYALPLRIKNPTNGGIVSKNYGTMIFRVSPKNAYDGVYTVVSGYVQRYSSPGVPTVNDALNGSLTGTLNLVTIDVNTVELQGLTWHGGGGVAGIDRTRAKIDPATNQITMFADGNPTLRNRPGMENKYEPASKRVTVNFDWNQTSTMREMGYVLEYLRPR